MPKKLEDQVKSLVIELNLEYNVSLEEQIELLELLYKRAYYELENERLGIYLSFLEEQKNVD